MLRFFRIVMSASFAVVSILLIVFWIRSYSKIDEVWRSQSSITFGLFSARGEIGILFKLRSTANGSQTIWSWVSQPASDYLEDFLDDLVHNSNGSVQNGFGFRHYVFSDGSYLGAPYWAFALTTVGFAAFPCIRWPRRFGIRTMFAAVAFAAIVLAAVTIYVRNRHPNTVPKPHSSWSIPQKMTFNSLFAFLATRVHK
jgi:hypothetical protein